MEEPPVLEPVAVDQTPNSLYHCLSYIIYDSFDRAAHIREQLWEFMAQKTFGYSLSELRRMQLQQQCPIILNEALSYEPVEEYIKSTFVSRRPRPITELMQRSGFAQSVSETFLVYILKHAGKEHAFPRIVCQLIADCYGYKVALFQRHIRRPDQYVAVAKWKPLKKNSKNHFRVIHLVWREPYFSLLVLSNAQKGILKVPEKCTKTLYYDPNVGLLPYDPRDRNGTPESSSSVIRGRSGYVVRVFDPLSRTNLRLADVISERIVLEREDCSIPIDSSVYTLPLESSVIRPQWIFSVQPKTTEDSYKRMFIFTSKQNAPNQAALISHWQCDYVLPHFYLQRDDTCLYIVQAESITDAITLMREQARIVASPYPVPTI